eukprot:Sspe_Gene.27574::Locus_11955_Transcript_1_1_Confidence_1.000_Length_1897::g.27574::m.27574
MGREGCREKMESFYAGCDVRSVLPPKKSQWFRAPSPLAKLSEAKKWLVLAQDMAAANPDDAEWAKQASQAQGAVAALRAQIRDEKAKAKPSGDSPLTVVGYCSEFCWEGVEKRDIECELAEVGNRGAEENVKAGIGSVMCYSPPYIYQTLEGPLCPLLEVLDGIRHDPRHTAFRLVQHESLAQRTLPLGLRVVAVKDSGPVLDGFFSRLVSSSGVAQAFTPKETEVAVVEGRGRECDEGCVTEVGAILHVSVAGAHRLAQLYPVDFVTEVWSVLSELSLRHTSAGRPLPVPTGNRVSYYFPISAVAQCIQAALNIVKDAADCRGSRELMRAREEAAAVQPPSVLDLLYPVCAVHIDTFTVCEAVPSSTASPSAQRTFSVIGEGVDEAAGLLRAAIDGKGTVLLTPQAHSRASKVKHRYAPRDGYFEVVGLESLSNDAVRELQDRVAARLKGNTSSPPSPSKADAAKQCKARFLAEVLKPESPYLDIRPPYLADWAPPVALSDLTALFQTLDLDRNGFLSRSEIHKYLTSFDPIGVPAMERSIHSALAECKLLGDDSVSFEEFCLLMLRWAQR